MEREVGSSRPESRFAEDFMMTYVHTFFRFPLVSKVQEYMLPLSIIGAFIELGQDSEKLKLEFQFLLDELNTENRESNLLDWENLDRAFEEVIFRPTSEEIYPKEGIVPFVKHFVKSHKKGLLPEPENQKNFSSKISIENFLLHTLETLLIHVDEDASPLRFFNPKEMGLSYEDNWEGWVQYAIDCLCQVPEETLGKVLIDHYKLAQKIAFDKELVEAGQQFLHQFEPPRSAVNDYTTKFSGRLKNLIEANQNRD